MKAVVAEKPSVAREIAAMLGATEKKDSYFIGNGYCVTWAFGHLVTLAIPEVYGVIGFQKKALPILPDKFLLSVKNRKTAKGYITDTAALQQLKVIEMVIKLCDSIVVATDTGREGELIFRYIYDYLNCDKPFERLWINSLTEKAISQGFKQLKPGSYFDDLYHAAKSRSRADWLVGINSSQALTIAIGNDSYSLGRVQTPVLAMICKRSLENKSFVTQKYWQIILEHRKEFLDFKSLSKDKWPDKKLANDALRLIQHAGIAYVSNVHTKVTSEQAPLLYDLTALQKEANKRLGFSADETLKIAQNLYEQKFISYPRTGSKYLPEDMWPEIHHLVRALDEADVFKKATANLKWGHFNKHMVNDVKITDHYGLLTTEKIPSALSAKENAIYELIAYRLLESLSPPCTKEITDITLQVSAYDFIIKGCKILEPGWREIKGSLTDDNTEILQEVPQLKTGNELKIKYAGVVEKKTNPPALYTEATLLAAMENAGREIENEVKQNALRGIGLGTPATRAAIIETLFHRDYIKRVKKSIIPTEKGLNVYSLVKDKKIADVTMTAEWEMALQKIENDELDANTFQKEIEAFTATITHELLNMSTNMEPLPELLCPKCKKQHLLIRDKIVKCTDEGCGWLQFRNVCEVYISVADIENLVTKQRTSLLKGMKSKSGKTFNAYIILNAKAESAFEFDNSKPKKK